MATSSRRVLIILVLFVVLVVLGLGVIALGFRAASTHVPSSAVLTIDIKGPIPERTEESPFGSLFSQPVVSLQDLRDGMQLAAKDSRVKAVRLRIHDVSGGFATMQEARAALEGVAKAGKPTSVYMDTAGEFSSGNMHYFLASACQKIVVNPMGDVNVIGLASRQPFVRGMLDKLEIAPDFPGIGKYKTARFMYTEKEMTPEQKEMLDWLLGSLSDQIAQGIGASRHMSPEQVKAIIAAGPYSSQDALKLKLIDELNDWESFKDEVGQSGKLDEVSLRRYLKSGRPNDSGTPIAVVYAEGQIIRGESGYSPVPVLGGEMMGSETMAKAWAQARESGAKAVIFRINSPGGSAIASEVIRDEMVRTAKKMPVIVSMSDVAGSGGYWITCGANRIVADPGTLTASIGVFGGHFAMSKFWEDKIGLTWGRVDTTSNAAIFGSLDPWTPEQKQTVMKSLDRIYDSFLDRVSASRKMSKESVDAIGRGRVFTGEQAIGKGLVDELGGFDTALAAAKKAAGLAPDAAVELKTFPRSKGFLQRIVERDEDAHAGLRLLQESLKGESVFPGPVWSPPIIVQ